jgi:hypothetical protein
VKDYKVTKETLRKILNELEAVDSRPVNARGHKGYGYGHVRKAVTPSWNLGKSKIEYGIEEEEVGEDKPLDKQKVKVSKAFLEKEEIINELKAVLKGYIDVTKLH